MILIFPPQVLPALTRLCPQVLYAGEGESRKPDDNATPPVLADTDRDKIVAVVLKGHEFVAISFHMPASCEMCTKPLWAPFRPPPAVECRRKYHHHQNHNTRELFRKTVPFNGLVVGHSEQFWEKLFFPFQKVEILSKVSPRLPSIKI